VAAQAAKTVVELDWPADVLQSAPRALMTEEDWGDVSRRRAEDQTQQRGMYFLAVRIEPDI